jgi:hypothetical protein
VISGANLSGDTTRIIAQYEFVQGADYKATSLYGAGSRPAKVCHFHPKAFAMCLARAKNTYTYCRFYYLLSACIASYDKYQIAMKDRAYGQVLGRNNRLEQMLLDLGVKTSEVKQQNVEMQSTLGEMKQQNETIIAKNDKLLTGVGEIKGQFTTVAEELHASFAMCEAAVERRIAAAADIAIPPENPAKSNSILLIHLDGSKYAVHCVQAKAVGAKLAAHQARYPGMREVVHLTDVPNHKTLWDNCLKLLKGRIRMVSPSSTVFTLEGDATETEVVSALHKFYNKPTEVAKLEGAVTKSRIAMGNFVAASAKTEVTRALKIITTTTETLDISSGEYDDLLAELLESAD